MVLRRIQVRTVVKVSAAFYLLVALLLTAGAAVAFALGSSFGVVHGIDRLATRLFNAHNFRLGIGMFVAGVAGVAAVVGLLGTALNALAALVYNTIASLTGGVRAQPASRLE